MKNFNLNNLTVFANEPFTLVDGERYASPIQEIINRNNLPLKQIEYGCYNNASMVRIDLEATNVEININKYLNSFDSLKSMHQKMFTKINGNYLSVYIPKLDVDRQTLSLRTLLDSEDYQEYLSEERGLPFVLGETVENKVIIQDLVELPHLLVAGGTGVGKSVLIHSFIGSLLYKFSPEELQFTMFDMKMVDLSAYEKIPHLTHSVCIESEDAPAILNDIVEEMQRRLYLMKQQGVFTLSRYNKLPNIEKIPYRVVIIDEFSSLIMNNKNNCEKSIIAIAQKGRAAGIHLVLTTQRPDANVVTGQIKSNITAYVALTVSSHTNSMIILDETGAELLNKKGDMLFKNGDGVFRLQGAYLTEKDIKMIVDNVCGRYGTSNFKFEIPHSEEVAPTPTFNYKRKYIDGNTKDGKYVLNREFYTTCATVIERDRASKTFIRSILNCGDLKANSFLDRMKNELKFIGDFVDKEKRYPLLITLEEFTENFINEDMANN